MQTINSPCPDPDTGLGDTVIKPCPDGNMAKWIYSAIDFADADQSTKILIELLSDNGARLGSGPGIRSGVMAFRTEPTFTSCYR